MKLTELKMRSKKTQVGVSRLFDAIASNVAYNQVQRWHFVFKINWEALRTEHAESKKSCPNVLEDLHPVLAPSGNLKDHLRWTLPYADFAT